MLSIPSHEQDHDTYPCDAFTSAVRLACRLIRVSEPATIRSVTVVGGRRLTGPEMLRLREEAAASDVLLAMDNTGDVRLRRGNS
jgi:hypothetical protein